MIVRAASVKKDIHSQKDWTDIHDLKIDMAAGDRWLVDYDLFVYCLSSGGIRLRLNGPLNPGEMGWIVHSRTKSYTNQEPKTKMGLGDYLAVGWDLDTYTGATIPVRIDLTFQNGSNPGVLNLQFAPTAAGVEVVVGKHSKMKAFLEGS